MQRIINLIILIDKPKRKL